MGKSIIRTILSVGAILAAAPSAFSQNDVKDVAREMAEAIQNIKPEQVAPQKPKYWNSAATFNLGFTHTSLTNWAAGGYNSMTLTTSMDAWANYAKKMLSWNNRIQLNYNFLWSADKKDLIQKSADVVNITSSLNYKTQKNPKWSYSISLNHRTQMTDTKQDYYKNESGKWDGTVTSSFLSPAYNTIALGMSWVPKGWFYVNMAPATGSITMCTEEGLRPRFGMPAREDGTYKSAIFQFGAQATANAKFTLNDKIYFETNLVLFSDYLDHFIEHTRVNWDNKASWQISRFISISVNTWTTYDPLIKIVNEKDKDKFPEGKARVQFKEYMAFSFTYTFKPKR